VTRIQLGVIEAQQPVAEGETKLIGRLDFDLDGGQPTKTQAQIVTSAEFLRVTDGATQAAIMRQLSSAVATATDVAFIASLTSVLRPRRVTLVPYWGPSRTEAHGTLI